MLIILRHLKIKHMTQMGQNKKIISLSNDNEKYHFIDTVLKSIHYGTVFHNGRMRPRYVFIYALLLIPITSLYK